MTRMKAILAGPPSLLNPTILFWPYPIFGLDRIGHSGLADL